MKCVDQLLPHLELNSHNLETSRQVCLCSCLWVYYSQQVPP